MTPSGAESQTLFTHSIRREPVLLRERLWLWQGPLGKGLPTGMGRQQLLAEDAGELPKPAGMGRQPPTLLWGV